MSRAINTLDRADVRMALQKLSDDDLWAELLWTSEIARGASLAAPDALRLEEIQLALLSRGLKSGMDIHYHAEWLFGGLL